jgi:subtilisin family serine protease
MNPRATALLIRLPAGAAGALGLDARRPLGIGGEAFDMEPLFTIGGGARGLAAADGGWEWHRLRPTQAMDHRHAWQLAHDALERGVGLEATDGVVIEPDLEQVWIAADRPPPGITWLDVAPACAFDDQKKGLPCVKGRFAWHLDDDFSQLRRARDAAAAGGTVRIVHLDTGFDPDHPARPAHVVLQKNFMSGEPADDARDPGVRGGPIANPGHGTGTIGLLAGGEVTFRQPGYEPAKDRLGGAPDAEVIPVRVANSVVQIMTSGIAQGIHYAVSLCESPATAVHVLSMSMGGVASRAWADVVNAAYDAGVVLVTAAGNNYSAGPVGVPTRFIVYPARFRRVIAACGVMADRRPYDGLAFGTMQGNYGPASKMGTALAAFTPNVSWAEMGCPGIVDMSGAGTSSATPQVAAAAALYMRRHADALARYPEPWMRVEAVRHALFTSADKHADGGRPDRLGNGIVRAADALAVEPPAPEALQRTPVDSATFAFLRVLTGLGLAAGGSRDEMFAIEATQLAQRWPHPGEPNPIERVLPDPDLPAGAIAPADRRRFIEALLEHPEISKPLRQHLETIRSGSGGPAPVPVPDGVPPRKANDGHAAAMPAAAPMWAHRPPIAPPEPPYRSVRGFSVDPSYATSIDTAPLSEITFKIPWETLRPGPVGEYLEVIDVDPASDCMYDPVDLDDPRLLAQDGLPPSEGTPQFHQQMAYAVASLTIHNFERALGRRVLWRPGPPADPRRPKDDSRFVQRLRIYPHALRQSNAYYSPAKIALLFGYFNALTPGDARPGPMVFAALSHDIIAHETTHALLDGMYRRLLEPSNPDVLAFHEAFADIVALFQHFTFPDIVRHQIASTRGQIRTQETILTDLAFQFGQAMGRHGALRSAVGTVEDGAWKGREPDPTEYDRITEPHARGGILVAAVFDAFLSIYERRTADLIRIATEGTGVLRPGAIHPDLVGRLADEASKAADHVLTMCIRALDYLPPLDITFGEYLRAILTADADVVRDDDLHYRIAFLEAFRRRGIQPKDVRTLSVESLLWRTAGSDEMQPSRALEEGLDRLRTLAPEFARAETLEGSGRSRERIFHLQRQTRQDLHGWLKERFQSGPEGARDAAFLGLDLSGPDPSFEVHSLRFAVRGSPDGDVVPQLVLSLLQRSPRPIDPDDPDGPTMVFEGGCAIIADLRRGKIRYVIRKNMSSSGRLARQQSFTLQRMNNLRSTYLEPAGRALADADAEPFALLHSSFEGGRDGNW